MVLIRPGSGVQIPPEGPVRLYPERVMIGNNNGIHTLSKDRSRSCPIPYER